MAWPNTRENSRDRWRRSRRVANCGYGDNQNAEIAMGFRLMPGSWDDDVIEVRSVSDWSGLTYSYKPDPLNPEASQTRDVFFKYRAINQRIVQIDLIHDYAHFPAFGSDAETVEDHHEGFILHFATGETLVIAVSSNMMGTLACFDSIAAFEADNSPWFGHEAGTAGNLRLADEEWRRYEPLI